MQVSMYVRRNISARDAIFLNIPKELETSVGEYSKGETSYEQLIGEAVIEGIIPEPLGAWEYGSKPILESLPAIVDKYPEVKVHCYSTSSLKHVEMQSATEQTRHILRAIIKNRVEYSNWRNVLKLSLEIEDHALESEACEIAEKVAEDSWVICGVSGGRLRKALKRAGIEAKCLYFSLPYFFNPLTALKRRLAKRSVEDDELEEHVRNHIEYLKDYMYKERSRDIAHYMWTRDKVQWMRHKLEKKEITLLDKIL